MFDYNRDAIAKRIKLIRKRANLTLKELGKLINAPISSISSWERGVSIPRANYLRLLSEQLDVSERWILYGTVDEYVQDVFDYYDLSASISEDVFFQIVDTLEENNFVVGDYYTLEETAKLYIDNFEQLILEEPDPIDSYVKPSRLTNEFPILENPEFQQKYLSFLSKLLNEENKEDNEQIILFLLDALSRMNNESKPLLKNLLRDINWMVTNNILMLNLDDQSEEAQYGNIKDSEAYNRAKNIRGLQDINHDVDILLKDTSSRLKSVVEINYEKLKRTDRKSIF